MLVKKLALTGACFSESGLFNELRQIQIRKKSSRSPNSRLGCGAAFQTARTPRRSAEQEIDSDCENMYIEAFCFCQENSLSTPCLLSRTRASGLDRKRPPEAKAGISSTRFRPWETFARSPDNRDPRHPRPRAAGAPICLKSVARS